MQSAYSEVDQASSVLQHRFGLSRRAADDITSSRFLNGEASAGLGGTLGPATLGVGAKGGRNQSWIDSDIGIASEDRDRISGALRQISDSHNRTSTREGFMRTVSTSSNSQVHSAATGLNCSLTETRTSSLEARRSEEAGRRLEDQASYHAGTSAAGNLNLSQSYRKWCMAEIENNRDYYGDVRFGNTAFQLGLKGQALERKFVECYAGQIKTAVESQLILPPAAPIASPSVSTPANVRRAAPTGAISAPEALPQGPAPSAIHDEVAGRQRAGTQRIGAARSELDGITAEAKGASAEAADAVKEWKPSGQ